MIRTTLVLVLAAGSVACAGDDECCIHSMRRPGFVPSVWDSESGRDLLNYPPDRVVDHQHMKLVIDIPDMNTPRASAVQTLTVTPIGGPVAALRLDAQLLEIQSVASPGRNVTHEYDGRTLTVHFDPPLEPAAAADIVTTYTINDPPEGLFWTPESESWPGRPAQIHTQGQTDTNSYWFPCHDFPNERLITELVVTVPQGYTVSANGKLLEEKAAAGRTTFHWIQEKPHVNYLVSMVIGKFDVVDVADLGARVKDAPRPASPVPMPVYVPPGRGKDVAQTYGRTAEMVGLFERITGEAYPWDRYAQLVVWNFGAGGMENTSATTMYDTAILSREGLQDGDLDGLIAHELAHQWFGDLITCKSWEHIWLNEGFATYFSSLWFGHRDGPDAYLAGILGNFDGLRASDRADAPNQWPMVRKEYESSFQTFGGPNSPYPRGSSVLHMLRQRLGDEVFFRAIAEYVDRYKYRNAETGDFRRVLEEVSGESLDQFFQQWCYRPGMPDLNISLDWDAAQRELVVAVKQTQTIDGYNPAYDFDLPLAIQLRSGDAKRGGTAWRTETVSVRGREASARIRLEAAPLVVAVDPNLAVLCRTEISQPRERWLAQLAGGPTLAAKVQAARALAADPEAGNAAILLDAAVNGDLPPMVRSEAVLAMKRRGDIPELLQVVASDPEVADVRVTAIECIAEVAQRNDLNGSQAAALKAVLVDYASGDWSGRSRAAALKGLGKLRALDQLKVIQAAAETPSQHDRVRQGAIEALGDLNAPGSLGFVSRFALPGTMNRTRPVAITAVRKLASQEPGTAFRVLAMLLKDRESRAWQAAGAALVELGDKRALDEFAALIEAKRDPGDRKTVQGWLDSLKSKLGTASASSASK
jgi:aminopeptidase N